MEQEMSNELQLWIEWDCKEKQQKLERFRRLNRYIHKGQIVFAGSSLMEQFPIYEFLQDFRLPFTIYNRGVGGFVTGELLSALDECILALEPAHLFINIGTNDLSTPDYEEAAMIGRYESILSQVEQALPNCICWPTTRSTQPWQTPHLRARGSVIAPTSVFARQTKRSAGWLQSMGRNFSI